MFALKCVNNIKLTFPFLHPFEIILKCICTLQQAICPLYKCKIAARTYLSKIFATWSHKNTYLCATPFYAPYCTFRQFQREMSSSGAKTQVKYVNPVTVLLRRYRYILLCFYYVATGTYCGGSEFKYPGSVPKS